MCRRLQRREPVHRLAQLVRVHGVELEELEKLLRLEGREDSPAAC